MSKKVTCLVCPRGCLLTVSETLEVSGNMCPRGIPYGKQEVINPMRTLTYSLRIKGTSSLLAVRSDIPLPKAQISEAVALLSKIVVEAPIAFNAIIVENILGTGANVISTQKIS